MFQTLRGRLTGVSVAIATLSLIVLSLVAFLVVRANMLQALDERIGGVTQLHAADLAQWVKDNQRVTGSLKAAVALPDPIPALLFRRIEGFIRRRNHVRDLLSMLRKGRYAHRNGQRKVMLLVADRQISDMLPNLLGARDGGGQGRSR